MTVPTQHRGIKTLVAKKNWREAMNSDRAVLMFCISIALIFWLLNKMSQIFSSVREIQLVYQVPQGKALSTMPLAKFPAYVKGSGWELLSRKKVNIPIVVSEDSFQVITNDRLCKIIGDEYNVSPQSVRLNFNEIKIRVEDEAQKIVRIAGISNIIFKKGYDLSQPIKLSPNVVTIKGPKSLLDTLRFVYTDTIELKELYANKSLKIDIADNPLLHYSIQTLDVTVRVEQFTEKTLLIPIEIKNQPSTMKVFPEVVDLTCTTTLSEYSKVDSKYFSAEVDMKGVEPNSKNNTLPVILINKQPALVRNVKISPQSVVYFLEK
jgi:hypothetical protein